MRVFISYRREDASGHAAHLYDTLSEELGDEDIFMDVETMEPGLDFMEAISQAVAGCEVLIAVIGPRWLTETDGTGERRIDDPNDFVRLEIEAALERNIRVIPVLVDGATVPQASELPVSLSGLTRRQGLEVTQGRWRFDVGRLLAVLRQLAGDQTGAQARRHPSPTSSLPTPRTHQAGPSPRPKTLLVGGAIGGVTVVVLVLVAVTMSGSNGGPEPPGPPVATTVGAFPSPAEEEVLRHISDVVKGTSNCDRPDDPFYPEAVGVVCDPNDTIRVSYYMFETAQEMDDVFDELVASKELPSASCNPPSNPSFSGSGTWGQPAEGRYACYVAADSPWIEWTHESTRISGVTFAVGDNKEELRQQLYDFWLNDAGPFS